MSINIDNDEYYTNNINYETITDINNEKFRIY